MSSTTDRITIRIGHSPDPDDAFMWYPLANDPTKTGPDGGPLTPRIKTGPYDFVHILEDIQSLNERAERAELEVTAVSVAQYPYIAKDYALTSCGASMGDGYGPKVVAPEIMSVEDLRKVRIAVPGERTSSFLALSLLLGKGQFQYEVVPFDQIMPAVRAGQFGAGLIIHEGQITYLDQGLRSVVDLGEWWAHKYALPLPLGGNAIRRDLGMEHMRQITRILRRSIEFARGHYEEALEYAKEFGRGIDRNLAFRFVNMYVNMWTLEWGTIGRKAIHTMLSEGAKAGIVPAVERVDIIEPAGASMFAEEDVVERHDQPADPNLSREA